MKRQVVDLFCGAGGVSTAILQAVDELQTPVRLTAVNHWPTAIDSHSLNHPSVHHICEPVETLWPARAVPGRRLWLLTASCECTFHSNARGGGPCNEQSRSQPWQIVRWITDLIVDHILMENVPEFVHWGPLIHMKSKGKRPAGWYPDPKRRGEFFSHFLATLELHGYRVEWKIQNTADFGDATIRRRFILLAKRAHGALTWPEPSHCDPDLIRATRRTGRRVEPWNNARDHVIDHSLPGRSIFTGDPKRPFRHCPNTMERICRGIVKFGGPRARSFLVTMRGTGKSHLKNAQSLNRPLPAVSTTGKHHLLVEKFLFHLTHQGDHERRCHSSRRPLPSVTGAHRGEIALAETFLIGQQSCAAPRSARQPVPTIAGKGAIRVVKSFLVQTDHQSGNGGYVSPTTRPTRVITSKQNLLLVKMLMKYYGTGICKPLTVPLDAVTTKDRFLLAEIRKGRLGIEILTRLLQPHELAAAHSFPKHYIFQGTKEDQTKQIGNSVPVKTAKAHVLALLNKMI